MPVMSVTELMSQLLIFRLKEVSPLKMDPILVRPDVHDVASSASRRVPTSSISS